VTSEISRVGRAGLLVLVGSVFSMFSGFLLRLILARQLSPSEFGAVFLAISVMSIGTIPCLLGLDQGLVKFISKKDMSVPDSLITVALSIVVGMGTLVSVLSLFFVFIFGNPFSSQEISRIFIYIIIISFPFFVFNSVIPGVFRGLMQSRYFVFHGKVLRSTTKVVLPSVAAVLFGSLAAVAIGLLLAFMFTAIVGIVLIWRSGWRPQLTPFPDMRGVLAFSLPLVISSSTFLLLKNIDRLFIGYFLTTDALAIYEIAVTIALLLGLFNSAFSFLIFPKVSELSSKDKNDRISPIYQQTTKWIIGLTTPAFLVIFLRPNILIQLFGSQYSVNDVQLPLMVVSIGLFVHAVVGPNGPALLGFGRSKSILGYNIIAATLNILLNFILIPTLGILGAAAASLAGYSLMNLLKSADLYLNHDIIILNKAAVMMSFTSFMFGGLLFVAVPKMEHVVAEFVVIVILSGLTLLFGITILYINSDITEADKDLFQSLVGVVRLMNR